jgi:hypothetical protein
LDRSARPPEEDDARGKRRNASDHPDGDSSNIAAL